MTKYERPCFPLAMCLPSFPVVIYPETKLRGSSNQTLIDDWHVHASAALKMSGRQMPVFFIAKSLQNIGSELTADLLPGSRSRMSDPHEVSTKLEQGAC